MSKSGKSAYSRHVFARGEKQKDLANGGEETKNRTKRWKGEKKMENQLTLIGLKDQEGCPKSMEREDGVP